MMLGNLRGNKRDHVALHKEYDHRIQQVSAHAASNSIPMHTPLQKLNKQQNWNTQKGNGLPFWETHQ
eukprot:c46053_g1_i1 orf=3-200(-)